MTSKADPPHLTQLFGELNPTRFTERPSAQPTERDLPRWAELSLDDPPRNGQLPAEGQTADVLAFGMTLPGSTDPIEGVIAAVAADHDALAHLFGSSARRLHAAVLLLRRADGRAPAPPPDGPDEGPAFSNGASQKGEAKR